MRVLVTGGCGYLGSALVPRLRDEPAVERITLLDSLSTGSPRNLFGAVHADLDFVRGDVREYGDVEAAMRDVDAVIHLAAITGAASTHDHPERTREVNFGGTENVVTAARKLGVDRVVFASSCNVYGRATSTDIDETTDPDPINPYARSKLDAEALLADADLDVTALRLSTVYGNAPGIRFNLVVNSFVFRALTRRPLTVYGDGSNWRPFIHARDAARAFADAVVRPDRWAAPVYNVGGVDANFRISEVAEVVRRTIDADFEVSYLEGAHPGPSYHVNFDRLAETGFELSWDLPAGVSELAEAFRADAPGSPVAFDPGRTEGDDGQIPGPGGDDR